MPPLKEDEFEAIKALFKSMILDGLTGGFHFDEDNADQVNRAVGRLVDEIKRLENELNGYKLSNQSLSNSLDKEIKENERWRKSSKEYTDTLNEARRKRDEVKGRLEVALKTIKEHKQIVKKYVKALEEINQTTVYYDERGWALNPERIEKIAAKALEG